MERFSIKKKQLIIFVAMAYGVAYLMGGLMWFGFSAGKNLSIFPNVQMMYPAAGVMLAYLITQRMDDRVPRRFFISYLIVTLLMAVFAVLSVVTESGDWVLNSQFVLMGGSILCWILMLTEKKEKRVGYGLKWKNGKASVLCILLFVALYLLRTAISYGMSGQLWMMGEIAKNPNTWLVLASLLINFFFVFLAFFGEEYGWRHYLQPLMQRRFGKRGGVLLLGVVWGIWHLPVNFFFNGTPDNGLILAAAQQITCITLGIFFAYAYMKTGNIWVPVILHFLNNNLIPVVTGTYSADVIQNQSATWISLIPGLLLNGVIFGGFLLAKVFRHELSNTR